GSAINEACAEGADGRWRAMRHKMATRGSSPAPGGTGRRGKVMRFAMTVLLALVLASASVSSAAPSKGAAPNKKKPEFASSEDILRWINNYRLKPEPAKLPAAVKAMSEHGVFRDMDAAGIYVGFMAASRHPHQPPAAGPRL